MPVLQRIGLDADPDTLVGDLDLAERQLVEISRVLVERPSVLILDEPNSALNERETQRLFASCGSCVAERHHDPLRLASAGGGLLRSPIASP